jgi:hypothetical protein
MGQREAKRVRAQREDFDSYIRMTAAGGSSSVDELARLSEIRSRGALTDEEFRRAKDLVLSGHGPAERPGTTGTGPSAH